MFQNKLIPIRWVLFPLSIISLCTQTSEAARLSPSRMPGESYLLAYERNTSGFYLKFSQSNESVIDRQISFQQINIQSIPEVPSAATVQSMHHQIRDSRSWFWTAMPSFPRRLTWLYPDDGCFLRAELMAQKLKELGNVQPKQIFAFGDLGISTPYETVNWWYHVAPVVRVKNQAYVIDPSVDYKRPLSIKEWTEKINGNTETTWFSICEVGAVSPHDNCDSVESTWDKEDRESTLQNYLEIEWTGLEAILGNSPETILGNSPPWNLQ